MTLNGRPEDTSISGATVKLLRKAVHKSFARRVRRRLENAAGDPAMPLIVHGVGSLEKGEAGILRLESGLQVGGVVDGVRPGVAGQQLKVVRKMFGHIHG